MGQTTLMAARLAGAVAGIALALGFAGEALAGFKITHWNVQSGYGKGGWTGTADFTPGSTCSVNAWGNGRGPLAKTLVSKVKHDSEVVALTLNEAWSCATPKRIQSLLGFAAVAPGTSSGEIGGVGIVARYGFAGSTEVKALPKCSSGAERRYVVRAPVYADSGRTTVVQVFATHWTGCDAEAKATVDFMQQYAYKGRSLTGDLNVKSVTADPIVVLKNGNYADVWSKLKGPSGGATATWNSTYGSPKGSLYKRIDYAFFKTLTALSITRFNTDGTPGVAKMADHAAIIVEYAR